MTMNRDHATLPVLTDAAIASMFEQRARTADGSDLRGSILAEARSTPQVRRRSLEIPTLLRPRLARLLLVALLVLATAALALLGSGALRQDRDRKLLADDFVRPFEYAIPPGSTLRAAIGGPHRNLIAWVDGPETPPDPTTQTVYGGQRPESGVRRGIIVASGDSAWSHSADGRFFLRTAPAEFVADLRVKAGVAMGPTEETTVDGRPAVTSLLTARNPDNDIHVDGSMQGLASWPYVTVKDPARILVFEVEGRTIFILAWARTMADLDAWTPVVDQFVASIHFLPGETPS